MLPSASPAACAAPEDVFEDLPPHLRDAARSLLARFVVDRESGDRESWDLSAEEIVAAITAPSFRPVLEQEARLDALHAGTGPCPAGRTGEM